MSGKCDWHLHRVRRAQLRRGFRMLLRQHPAEARGRAQRAPAKGRVLAWGADRVDERFVIAVGSGEQVFISSRWVRDEPREQAPDTGRTRAPEISLPLRSDAVV